MLLNYPYHLLGEQMLLASSICQQAFQVWYRLQEPDRKPCAKHNGDISLGQGH